MSSQNKVALKFSERREVVKNSQYLGKSMGLAGSPLVTPLHWKRYMRHGPIFEIGFLWPKKNRPIGNNVTQQYSNHTVRSLNSSKVDTFGEG